MTDKQAMRVEIGQRLQVVMAPYSYKCLGLAKGIGINRSGIVIRVQLFYGPLLTVKPHLVELTGNVLRRRG